MHFAYDLQGRLGIAISTTFDGSSGTATRIERTTYDYDHTGIRVSAVTEVNADPQANADFESRTETRWLNDPQNFTGYSQVLRETHSDLW